MSNAVFKRVVSVVEKTETSTFANIPVSRIFLVSGGLILLSTFLIATFLVCKSHVDFEYAKSSLVSAKDSTVAGLHTVFTAVRDFFVRAYYFLVNLVKQLLTFDFSGLYESVKQIATAVLQAIVAIFNEAKSVISGDKQTTEATAV